MSHGWALWTVSEHWVGAAVGLPQWIVRGSWMLSALERKRDVCLWGWRVSPY